MLMRPHDRRVNRDRPVQRRVVISYRSQRHHDPIPCPVAGVAALTLPNRLPSAETLRQITPRHTGPQPIQDALDDLPVVLEIWASRMLGARQQLLNQCPLRIREHPKAIISTGHSEICCTTTPSIIGRHALVIRDIWVLRLRALLEKARGGAAYRDY